MLGSREYGSKPAGIKICGNCVDQLSDIYIFCFSELISQSIFFILFLLCVGV